MAIVHAIYSVRVQDFIGDKGNIVGYVQIDDSKTVAQLVTEAAAYNAFLDSITDAMGLRARLELLLPPTGMKSSISVNNRLESGGLFTFNQQGIGRADSMVIPAYAESQIVNGKPDLSGGSTTSLWISRITTSGATFTFESPERYFLDTFLRCRLNARKYRKSDTRMTSETP